MIDRIGHFSIQEKLGEGGMGIVSACLDEALERRVAIKVMRDSADPSAKTRLLHEAKAAARVSHPHICQVYEVGETEGRLHIVMELLEGESLSARIARAPPFLSTRPLRSRWKLLPGLERSRAWGRWFVGS